ncbi:hypothetical protein AL073_08710 [Loktanella sp. 1ANDIMAR09]|nr:hypothetical protein AL073_08710 [Loktanella sp. 1ANDIMAR09]
MCRGAIDDLRPSRTAAFTYFVHPTPDALKIGRTNCESVGARWWSIVLLGMKSAAVKLLIWVLGAALVT